MADTPSTSSSMSPKQNLPTSFSLMEKGNRGRCTCEFTTNLCVSPTYFQKIIAELLGTYILIFAGCGVALTERELKITILGIALVWGLSLMALIYAFGHVSGAHFNPAVSIALDVAQKFPFAHVRDLDAKHFIGQSYKNELRLYNYSFKTLE